MNKKALCDICNFIITMQDELARLTNTLRSYCSSREMSIIAQDLNDVQRKLIDLSIHFEKCTNTTIQAYKEEMEKDELFQKSKPK